ncbi:MAG: hypothetical protein IJ702_06470, partial [Fretibacterium sp.]|nr:hypothetical protein [Fretibacterium sp.]
SWAGGAAWQTPSLIEFFKTANASTGFHEMGHHILRVMVDVSKLDGASAQLKDDINTILDHAGVTMEEFETDRDKRTQAHEYFARSWETYLSEGKAPTPELQGAFDRIRQWMIEVYHDVVQALGIELSDEMRDVFDRILATPDQLAEQRQIGNIALEEMARAEEMKKTAGEIEELEAQIAAEPEEEADQAPMPEDEEQKALDEVGAWFDEQARLKEQGESDYPADWGEVEPDSRGEAYDQIIGPQGAERLDAEDAGNRIDNLGMARQMEEAGKDKKTIRLATGWERGTDGKWKFEILDGELRQENVKEDSITTLGEIYDAPELYAAYPELKDRKVVISNLTGTHFGGYVNSEGTIWLNPEAKSIKSEVVHEVQHVVQEIEGFMRGGFVGEAYRKVGGEVEARNAQTRLDMTAEERRNTLLTETEDVAPEDQVILRDAVEVAENIRRGTEAMEKVITEQTDVMNAMRRDDVGDISFFWGEPGRGEKFKHGWGISHLLAHRDAQHQKDPQRYPDGMSVLRKMPEVIAKGEIVRDVGEDIPNAQRVNIAYDGYTAILSLYKDGNRQTWLLTGWKDDEKSSDASGEVYGPTGATLDGPTRFRPEEGAEVSGTSLPETGEAVNEAQMAGNAADSEADKHAEKAALQAEGSDSVTDSATDSAAEIDAYNAAMEEYEVKKTAREYVETIMKLIRQNGGLRLEDFIHDVGEEAAKELRKKWPGLFRNTQQGPQLQLDVLTQQLQANGIDLDVRGLVDWLTDTLNEKPEKPVPPALTAKTLKAVVEKYGGEAASQYLAERKKYLEKLIRKEENPEQFKLLTKELRAVDRLIAGEKAARKIGKLKEHYRDWITRLKAEHKAKLAAQKEKYKGRSADAEIRRRLELGSQKATLERKANARLQQMRERLRQLKDRYAAMEAQRKERRKLGQEIDKTVKDINRMANSKTIRYGRQEEIQALLKDYDLKRRGKKTMNRRAEVTTLLYINGMLDNQGVRPMSEEEMTFLGLTPKDLKYIGATALNDMTLGDLKALQNQVGAVFELGKAEFDAWKTDQQERRAAARGALKESLDKKHGPAPKVVAGAEDLGKQYTGILGTLEKAKDWVYSTWMTSDRFFDWLDGGHTKYNGAFVKYFADGLNAATDEAKEHVQERVKWIQDELRKLGFKMSDFSKKAADAAGRSWTWNEVMELYLGMRNEKKAKAIIYGNFVNGNGQGPVMSAEQAQATIQQLISVLTPEHRAAAELVIQDHEANFDRLNRRYIDSINRGMRQEVDYTSIHRLEHQTQHGLIDMNDEAALENGMSDAAIMKRVETGFMLERQAIADENQSPVMLGLFSNWMNDISRHEQAAAMLQIGTDLTSALMSKGEEGRPLIKQLSDKFGDNARRALVSFFNDSVTDGQRLAFDFLGDLSNGVARNMSIAYIAGNCGTVLKQTTSIPRFLITAGAHRLIWATARFLTNPTAFLERAYALDPQLRDRGGDTLISAVLRSPEWGKAAYQRGLEWMFTPVSAMDRWVAAIGWTATYEANLAKGATQEHAIREAQRAVRLTQQAASAKDLPRMWRNGGVMKLMMMFTSDTAATLGMTAYDFAQQVSSGEWNTTMKAFSTVLALAVTAAAMKAARDGVGGDDDDEDGGLGSWMGSALTEEFISSLPLIGKEAMMFYEELSGKWHGTTYSAFMTPIVKLFKGIGLLTDEDEDEDAFWRASGMFLDAAALSGVAPVPATAIRRVVRSAVMMGEDDAGNAVRNLLGMRVRQEE